MATPGWYPDPAGQPGAFRYWDGAAWGAELRGDPYGRPPAGADDPTMRPAPPSAPPNTPPNTPPGTPPPPVSPTAVTPGHPPAYGQYDPGPGYGQPPAAPGWSSGAPAQPSWSTAATPSSGGGGAGKTIGLVLLAVVMVIALGVGTFFVVRSVTDDDDPGTAGGDPTSAADPSTDPTADPTDDPTADPTEPTEPTDDPTEEVTDPFTDGNTPNRQQCRGGEPAVGGTGEQGGLLTGGGLAMDPVSGYTLTPDQAPAFTFADGVLTTSKEIERTETTGWVAVYALGSIAVDRGFTSPGQAAGVVLECMAQSRQFYTDFTGATLLSSAATTVDGADAWTMDAEIRIDNPELTVQGDIAKVVVVDTGDPATYGLFVSVVPIGDQALIDQQQGQAALLALQ